MLLLFLFFLLLLKTVFFNRIFYFIVLFSFQALSSEADTFMLTTAMTTLLQQEDLQSYEKSQRAVQLLKQFKETVEVHRYI